MTGERLTPSVVFRGEKFFESWLPKDAPEWNFGTSSTGLIYSDTALKWLKETFIPETSAGKDNEPVILLLHLHSVCNKSFLKVCEEFNIVYVPYPEYSNEVCNPFRKLYFFWPEVELNEDLFRAESNTNSENRLRATLIAAVIQSTMFSKDNILDAWYDVGLEPYNPQQVLSRAEVKRNPLELVSRKPAWVQEPDTASKAVQIICDADESEGEMFARLVELSFRQNNHLDLLKTFKKLCELDERDPSKWGKLRYLPAKWAQILGSEC